ncbi:hypothetical protein OSTOST_16509 [Ostertagia ostertagi]
MANSMDCSCQSDEYGSKFRHFWNSEQMRGLDWVVHTIHRHSGLSPQGNILTHLVYQSINSVICKVSP